MHLKALRFEVHILCMICQTECNSSGGILKCASVKNTIGRSCDRSFCQFIKICQYLFKQMFSMKSTISSNGGFCQKQVGLEQMTGHVLLHNPYCSPHLLLKTVIQTVFLPQNAFLRFKSSQIPKAKGYLSVPFAFGAGDRTHPLRVCLARAASALTPFC